MQPHLISHIHLPEGGPAHLRIGDLNNDGCLEILTVQQIRATREITCLTAMDIRGRKLWQHGSPAVANNQSYSDLPIQIFDWDDDGRSEVLYITQATYAETFAPDEPARERAMRYEGHATLHVLDGETGQEKRTFPLPAPADDALAFADFTGSGHRRDLLVKDRYWNMWAISHEGEVLWHWEGETGHYPAIGDIDGDGRDEVFVGYALIDHDGKVLYRNPVSSLNEHADANVIHFDEYGRPHLLFGNHGVHCMDFQGNHKWLAQVYEAQHVNVARFRREGPWQVAAYDRGPSRFPEAVGVIHMYDMDGNELWQRTEPPGSWLGSTNTVHWSDPRGLAELLVYRRGINAPTRIYDGQGEVVAELPQPWKDDPDKPLFKRYVMAIPACMRGDGRDDVILYGQRDIAIYANPRPLANPRHYNDTHYLG